MQTILEIHWELIIGALTEDSVELNEDKVSEHVFGF